ncbi:MAG: 50S ribosome-binding GTPase [Planctomycetes bacterium]|nr:50S ribosome-binding GTPase [Planctomycetota bacterium]
MAKVQQEVMRACRLGLGGIVQLWCRGDSLVEALPRLVVNPDGQPIKPVGKGKFQHGILRGESGDIDEILLAWTEWGAELNCHGGSACATAALRLLQENGFKEISPENWWFESAKAGRISLAECEARLRLPQAVTPLQVRLLSHALQLEKSVQEWIDHLSEVEQNSSLELLEKWIAAYAGDQIILKKHVVAVVGAPNVGKSTLFNALLSLDRAMVSELAGTTRDAVRQNLILDGLSVELVDTAGLLEKAAGADAEAVRRAREILQAAELCLLILDGSREFTDEDRHAWQACQGVPTLVIINKNDLPQVLTEAEYHQEGIKNIDLKLSALEDREVGRLAEMAATKLWGEHSPWAKTSVDNLHSGIITARQFRHLASARDSLAAGDMKAAAGSMRKIIKTEVAELDAIREELKPSRQA